MKTKEIAQQLKLTAQLMELHGENKFKIRSLSNAAFKLDKLGMDLSEKKEEEIALIDGIGKSTAKKIVEIQSTGNLGDLSALLEKTPLGVVEMLGIKGIGPKKVAQLWKELEIESPGELLYACNENRLVDLKGFGTKTQNTVKEAIEFSFNNAGKFHYGGIEDDIKQAILSIKEREADNSIEVAGAFRRKCEIIDKIEIVALEEHKERLQKLNFPVPTEFIFSSKEDFAKTLFKHTGSDEHLKKVGFTEAIQGETEEEIYKNLGFPYIEPELREGRNEVDLAKKNQLPKLISLEDLKGTLHNHTSYSDGIHSLKEMAEYCKEIGYRYLGVCDHSKSAFYANGLNEERVAQQHEEIDQLNNQLAPFKIFKGIESDILYDGGLDYDDATLATFDFVVASVHSVLKMNEEKATSRLITAIENPHTTILGHPTGRLLLSRPGYPIDHKKVIDACAANNVIMELNSHPYRLDIDWRWIEYCLEKGVKISINPDAHKKEGYHDMYYGVCVARKGLLTADMCFNAMDASSIEQFFSNQ